MDFGLCGELCVCCQCSGSPLDSQSSPKPCSNPCAHPVPSTARTGARSSPEAPVQPAPPPQPGVPSSQPCCWDLLSLSPICSSQLGVCQANERVERNSTLPPTAKCCSHLGWERSSVLFAGTVGLIKEFLGDRGGRSSSVVSAGLMCPLSVCAGGAGPGAARTGGKGRLSSVRAELGLCSCWDWDMGVPSRTV